MKCYGESSKKTFKLAIVFGRLKQSEIENYLNSDNSIRLCINESEINHLFRNLKKMMFYFSQVLFLFHFDQFLRKLVSNKRM